MRIGLFGGSFNPPHQGHLAASLTALKRLKLDRVWWLVSPQNPLKPKDGTPPLSERVAAARAFISDRRLLATGIEAKLGTRYTADTLAVLKARYPGVRFVLIIGADNFSGLPRWDRWTAIMETVPIAVVARPGYEFPALNAKPAQRYARARIPAEAASLLATRRPPAWTFLLGPLDPSASSKLRANTWTKGAKSTI
jgi:nicotinate-nucleotide adenylyltransferase